MARKTDGEKIDELVVVSTTLTERLNAVLKEIEGFPGLITRVAVLEQQNSELRNRADEASRRRWSLLPSIVSAVLGGIVTLCGQAVIRTFLALMLRIGELHGEGVTAPPGWFESDNPP